MVSKGIVLLVEPRLFHQVGRREVWAVVGPRRCSTKAAEDGPHSTGLEPPDVAGLARTARISLTPREVEEFGPKIRRVVDWFGQLQNVELSSVEPAIRADTEGGDAREDIPETFNNPDALIAAIPSYEMPYIKVPKVLNKE